MALIQNGASAFQHPFTGQYVGPYQWYEGNAHQEHENVIEDEVAEEVVNEPAKLSDKLVKAAEEFGIDIAGLTDDEVKKLVQEKAKEAKELAKKDNGEPGKEV